MIFIGVSCGRKEILPNPIFIRINQEIAAMADMLTVSFAYCEDFPKLERIFAVAKSSADAFDAVDKGEVLFSGIVDEQTLTADSGSATITVYARSLAALLIDNECMAASYIDPSLDIIVRNHLEPWGITCADDGSLWCKGELRAYKDSTHAGIAESFCKNFLGTVPRVDHKGVFYTNVYRPKEKITFSNKNGIPFDRISICESRYGRISKIFLKTGRCYDTVLSDDDAVNAGILRERYLDISANGEYSMLDADKLIANGIANSISCNVRCSDRIINMLGCFARVDMPTCENVDFVVDSIDYQMKNGKEYTKIKLKTAPKSTT